MANKKVYILIVILAILMAGALGVHYYLKNHKPGSSQVKPAQQAASDITPITAAQAIALLPKGLPIEAGASLTQSYMSTVGSQQTVGYPYNSKKSLADLMTDYQKFFTTNKWKVTVAQNTDQLKVLSAASPTGGQTLLVNLAQNSVSGQTVVNLSFISPAPEDFSKGFPSDFPQENGVKVNTSQQSTDYGSIYTMAYASSLTLANSEIQFTNYLSAQGWASPSYVPNGSGISIRSSKGNVSLAINYDTQNPTVKPNVNISLAQFLKKPQTSLGTSTPASTNTK